MAASGRSRFTGWPGFFSPKAVRRRVSPERSAAKELRVELDDGEAASVDGNAVAEFHFGCDGRSAFEADAQAAAFFVVLKLFNFSDVLGDSRKHRESILERRNPGRSDSQ